MTGHLAIPGGNDLADGPGDAIRRQSELLEEVFGRAGRHEAGEAEHADMRRAMGGDDLGDRAAETAAHRMLLDRHDGADFGGSLDGIDDRAARSTTC